MYACFQREEMMLGETQAPWEEPAAAATLARRFGHLQDAIFALLDRDPVKRPCMAVLQRACRCWPRSPCTLFLSHFAVQHSWTCQQNCSYAVNSFLHCCTLLKPFYVAGGLRCPSRWLLCEIPMQRCWSCTRASDNARAPPRCEVAATLL